MKISDAAPGTILLDKDGVPWERLDRGAIVTTGDESKIAWEEPSLQSWGDKQNGPFTPSYEDNEARQLQKIRSLVSEIKTVYDGYKNGDVDPDVAMYRISKVTGWSKE